MVHTMNNKNFIVVIKTEQVYFLQRCFSFNHFNPEDKIFSPSGANPHEIAQNSALM